METRKEFRKNFHDNKQIQMYTIGALQELTLKENGNKLSFTCGNHATILRINVLYIAIIPKSGITPP